MRWTALVLAGSRPGRDAFAESHGTDLKALIPVGGVPMVVRPVRALLAAPEIEAVRVLAQQPERIAAVLPDDPRLSVEASGATIAATIEAILADPATTLSVAGDDRRSCPARRGDDRRLLRAGGGGGPGHRAGRAGARSMRACRRPSGPGSSFAAGPIRAPICSPSDRARRPRRWRCGGSVEQDRKKGWRMIAALGPAMLLGAVLRLRTLDQTLGSIGRRLGLSIRKVELANPLAAVDVDKPADHALVTAILEGRA